MSNTSNEASAAAQSGLFQRSHAVRSRPAIPDRVIARHLMLVARDCEAEGDKQMAWHLLETSYLAYDEAARTFHDNPEESTPG